MKSLTLETPRLNLVVDSPQATRERLDSLTPEEKTQLSPDWLTPRVEAATEPDPWVHGFTLVRRDDGVIVGQSGFKGPPHERVVEIAYFVAPEFQGLGYATEAAEAMVEFAARQDGVATVRAHTLPESNASTRVLDKCGFQKLGEVIDPEDGQVWRWERGGLDAV